MGLDTSHNCWHGAYSSFNEWRRAVAKAVGIQLDSMVGFGGETEWGSLKPDPLHKLLNHSDCDGEILAADCGPIANRLEEVMPLIPMGDGGPWGHRAKTEQFIVGLRSASEAGENVDFH